MAQQSRQYRKRKVRDIVFPEMWKVIRTQIDYASKLLQRTSQCIKINWTVVQRNLTDGETKMLEEEEEERDPNDWVDDCHQLEIENW